MRANLCDEQEQYAFCVQEAFTEVTGPRRAGPRQATLLDFMPKPTETRNKYAALEEEEEEDSDGSVSNYRSTACSGIIGARMAMRAVLPRFEV